MVTTKNIFMHGIQLILLIAIFFVTSVISVITGSTSLITVPVMLQFGIEPRTALATNMLALTFMSIGGTLPFIGKKLIDYNRLRIIIFLTILGSIIGALLVLVIAAKSMPIIISVLMIIVTIFSITNRNAGVILTIENPSPIVEIAGYIATFVLGVYGGFFSGGYVTMLTAAYVSLFRMTFVQAVANTKLINIFSSLIATIIFLTQGIVDYKLGIILSITMFIGGIVGSQVALKLNNIWLRRIFITTVIALGIKTLLDFPALG
ncbi:MAG: sulfite exporter TauE/SafE family protein [Nostoc sp. ChiSLP01]|nr:sulfite exporter TauE/SafE family protein [Nostoc sp. CmiSLP01]MDZ8286967.1 sulfite exporter TauE/SafE family protein [Nostoc sp. ChiSLP01]